VYTGFVYIDGRGETLMRKTEAIPNVQFRITDAKTYKKLSELAKAYGLSPGQFARQVVMEYLEDAERLRIRERLTEVESEQKKLRRDLANSVLALLIFAGNRPQEEATEWVEKNLRLH
jgi:hypothetical protein